MFFAIANSTYRGVRAACTVVVDTVSSVLGYGVSSTVLTEEMNEGATGIVLRQGIGIVCHVVVWRVFLWYFLGPIPAYLFQYF